MATEGMPLGQKGFRPGHAKIEGAGRPKGARTKNTEIRELFRDLTIDKFPRFVSLMEKIDDPKDYCDIYLKVTERVIPKISALQFETDDSASSALEHLRNISSWE